MYFHEESFIFLRFFIRRNDVAKTSSLLIPSSLIAASEGDGRIQPAYEAGGQAEAVPGGGGVLLQ